MSGWVLIGASRGETSAGSETAGFAASNLADFERADAPWQSDGGSALDTTLVTDHGHDGAQTSGVSLLGGYWPSSSLRARIRRLSAIPSTLLIASHAGFANYVADDVTNITVDPTDPSVFAAVATPTNPGPAIMLVDFEAWPGDAATGERKQLLALALRRKSGTYVETATGPSVALSLWDGVSAWVEVLPASWIPSEGVYSARFDASISTDIATGNQLRVRLSVAPGAGDAMEIGGVSLTPDVGGAAYDSGWIHAGPSSDALVPSDERLDDIHFDERPPTSILHGCQDQNGDAVRQAARYTMVELDPSSFYENGQWVDASSSIHWQRAIDGDPTLSNQTWTIYLEGPGISGPGPNQVKATQVGKAGTIRTMDGTPWISRRIDPMSLLVALSDLATATALEVVELLYRAGDTHPVSFLVTMLEEDGDRAYSAAGTVSGFAMTTRTGCVGLASDGAVHDIKFTLTETGNR